MQNEIWVALLALVGTVVGSGMGVWQSNRLVNYRMSQLENKMDKHNNLIERMTIVEQSTKSAHKRLDEIIEHEH